MNTATWVLDVAPEITVTEVADRQSWDALFAFAPDPHFTQAWCYGEGKRAEGWQVERLLFNDEDGIAALCQLLVKHPFGARVTRIDRGPVFLREHPSPELQLAVFQALRRRWRFGWRGLLLMAPSLPANAASASLLRAAGFWCRRETGWHSSYLDLALPLDQLHRRLAPHWRTRIRRAEKLEVGLRLRRDPAGIDWLLERHVENMHVKGFIGPSPEFVRAMYDASPKDFWLLQAMTGGEPEAALLVGRFGQHAETFIGWTSDTGRRAAAGNFLLWNAVIEMQRAGCRTLDLGGVPADAGQGQFKRGMRGAEYELAGEWLAF
ncbi:MAG TPA: GNAT family N-acetyltransferase [Steroidobacteraceae bacterium]|nr:GNAT family N-acetyltransferase [Steroidobacteraceae bacterium]